MRIISINLNGIRAAARKGVFDWLDKVDADVICMQETKAQVHQLEDPVFHPEKYYNAFFDAEKKGYSGVAIYAKKKPDQIIKGLGFATADTEGRYIQFDYGNLSIASLYLPSGSSKEERLQLKFDFMERYMAQLAEQRQSGREYIICGDWNTVHREIDIKNFKSNQKNSGCLPEERAWIDQLFNEVGYIDTFREINPEPHQYTWWSNRGQAWANNVGWRIDYQIATPGMKQYLETTHIYKDERFSDHAPLIVDYSVGLHEF